MPDERSDTKEERIGMEPGENPTGYVPPEVRQPRISVGPPLLSKSLPPGRPPESRDIIGRGDRPVTPKPQDEEAIEVAKEHAKLNPDFDGPDKTMVLAAKDMVHDGASKANPVEAALHNLATAVRHHLRAQGDHTRMTLEVAKVDQWMTNCERKVCHARDLLLSAVADQERKGLGIDNTEAEKRPGPSLEYLKRISERPG